MENKEKIKDLINIEKLEEAFDWNFVSIVGVWLFLFVSFFLIFM
jgi:hypothetical protein